MADQKWTIAFCFLYDFEQGNTTAHPMETSIRFEECVKETCWCRECFQHSRSGNQSLEDEQHAHFHHVVNDEVLEETR